LGFRHRLEDVPTASQFTAYFSRIQIAIVNRMSPERRKAVTKLSKLLSLLLSVI
jgi:hypothetical protein